MSINDQGSIANRDPKINMYILWIVDCFLLRIRIRIIFDTLNSVKFELLVIMSFFTVHIIKALIFYVTMFFESIIPFCPKEY